MRISQFGLLAIATAASNWHAVANCSAPQPRATEPLPSDYKSLYETVTGESLKPLSGLSHRQHEVRGTARIADQPWCA